MSKIINLIDFYNGRSLNKDKIPGNSKKFTSTFKISDLPKPRKK